MNLKEKEIQYINDAIKVSEKLKVDKSFNELSDTNLMIDSNIDYSIQTKINDYIKEEL